MSLGVITRVFPASAIDSVLSKHRKEAYAAGRPLHDKTGLIRYSGRVPSGGRPAALRGQQGWELLFEFSRILS